jgi:hypothetical protein
LKVQYDEPLSNFAFNFNLCRYRQLDFADDFEYTDPVDGSVAKKQAGTGHFAST